MSIEILQKVKNFLVKLVKDQSFRSQLMSEKVEEVRKTLEGSGYNFSQDEFETAAIRILELKELGQFEDLSEEELVAAVGGIRYAWFPPKGHPHRPCQKPCYPKPFPKPDPQPLYGIVVDPPVQALYGVVVPTDKTAD